jgi:hypothetical protein
MPLEGLEPVSCYLFTMGFAKVVPKTVVVIVVGPWATAMRSISDRTAAVSGVIASVGPRVKSAKPPLTLLYIKVARQRGFYLACLLVLSDKGLDKPAIRHSRLASIEKNPDEPTPD